MILTPLAASIAQYLDGDSIGGSSKGLLVGGKNNSGLFKELILTAAQALVVDDSASKLVIFVASRISCSNNASTSLIAANSARKCGSYLVNNTAQTFYLAYGAAAVLSQGMPLYSGQIFIFNTTQEIRGIQNSGGSLSLDCFEAT